MKVEHQLRSATKIAKSYVAKEGCMLLTRKTLSINNVKDNFIIFAKNIV